MKKQRILVFITILVLISLLLSACGKTNPLEDTPREETGRIRGFWGGLWDGLTATFAWLGKLLGAHWEIYEVHNNGGWYDFGFLTGLVGIPSVIRSLGKALRSYA